MKINPDFVLREISGDYIIVPTGKTTLNYNGLFTLSEVGAFIWKCIPDAADKEDIIQSLMREYEVTHEDAEKDTTEFLDQLKKYNMI